MVSQSLRPHPAYRFLFNRADQHSVVNGRHLERAGVKREFTSDFKGTVYTSAHTFVISRVVFSVAMVAATRTVVLRPAAQERRSRKNPTLANSIQRIE